MTDTSADHGTPDGEHPPVSRRTVLQGVMAGGAIAAGGALLGACSSDDGADAGATTTPTPTDSKTGGGGGNGGVGGDEVLVATSEVPDGGGVILSDQQVVVTQPTSGEFVGFSSICTHAGCKLSDVTDGTINCTRCHGSQFSIEDGSVVTGPATAPLPAVEVTVDGDSVVRA